MFSLSDEVIDKVRGFLHDFCFSYTLSLETGLFYSVDNCGNGCGNSCVASCVGCCTECGAL